MIGTVEQCLLYCCLIPVAVRLVRGRHRDLTREPLHLRHKPEQVTGGATCLTWFLMSFGGVYDHVILSHTVRITCQDGCPAHSIARSLIYFLSIAAGAGVAVRLLKVLCCEYIFKSLFSASVHMSALCSCCPAVCNDFPCGYTSPLCKGARIHVTRL